MSKLNKKIVLFIDPSDKAYLTPSKIGNLFMNRFAIDEDAKHEILKIYHLENTLQKFTRGKLSSEEGLDLFIYTIITYDSQVKPNFVRPFKEAGFLEIIDAGVATMVDLGANDMMPHFIQCIYHSLDPAFYYYLFEKLKEIILKKIQEYGIKSSILTMLHMDRINLLTKEKSKLAAEGKLKNELGWRSYEGSINDDLDLFINNLQNSNEVEDEVVWSFFLPKLTKEELKLVEEKNEEHMRTYDDGLFADVGVEEMKKSDSKDKYLHSGCLRGTAHLTLESNQTPSKDEPSNDNRSPITKRSRR